MALAVLAVAHTRASEANTLTLGPNLKAFYVSTTAILGGLDHVLDAGGDGEGTLNGLPLSGLYCVAITNPVYLGQTYPTTEVTDNGMVFGQPVNQAGTIAWLMTHKAIHANTWNKQRALQAAIWRTEYGTDFELDGADNAKEGNDPEVIAEYRALIAASSGKSTPLNWVYWISPNDTTVRNYNYQGLVGLRLGGVAAPEPGTALLAGVGLAVLAVRRRR